MANENNITEQFRSDTIPNRRKRRSTPNNLGVKQDLIKTYEEKISVLYSLVIPFLDAQQAVDFLQVIATKLIQQATLLKYKKYNLLLWVQTVYLELQKNSKFITFTSKTDIPQHLTSQLTFDEYFLILLRDACNFSVSDISTILQISEGAVRSRISKIRSICFPLLSIQHETILKTDISKNSIHHCIFTQEEIENLSIDKLMSDSPTRYDCQECQVYFKRRIVSLKAFLVYQQTVLPEVLQKYSSFRVLSKQGNKIKFNLTSVPWYFKIALEGLIATALVLAIVVFIPKAKNLYELWQDKNFDASTFVDLTSNAAKILTSPSVEQSTPEVQQPAVEPNQQKKLQESIRPESEFIGRNSDLPSSDKVYRILIKSDSPETLKTSVLEILRKASYESADESQSIANELPGGILFDAFIPLTDYKNLMNSLTKLGDTKIIITRTKERQIKGKTHIKIWVQRI